MLKSKDFGDYNICFVKYAVNSDPEKARELLFCLAPSTPCFVEFDVIIHDGLH